MIDLDPVAERLLKHFFYKGEKVIAFEISPGQTNKLVLVKVDKNSLVSLKDWQRFKGLCISVYV